MQYTSLMNIDNYVDRGHATWVSISAQVYGLCCEWQRASPDLTTAGALRPNVLKWGRPTRRSGLLS